MKEYATRTLHTQTSFAYFLFLTTLIIRKRFASAMPFPDVLGIRISSNRTGFKTYKQIPCFLVVSGLK